LIGLIDAVGEGCGRGLVHYSRDFEAGYLPCVYGGLALVIIEVSGDGDHCLCYLFS